MKNKLFQKVLCVILSVTTLFSVFAFAASAATDVKRGTNRDTASSLDEMQALVGVSSYDEYLLEHGAPVANTDATIVDIDLVEDMVPGGSAQKPSVSEVTKDEYEDWPGFLEGGEDIANTSVYLPTTGSTTWRFELDDNASGYYYIRIEFYNCLTSESSISTIERKLLIDGAAPFDEASYITLNKTWNYTYVDSVEAGDTDKELGYVSEPEYDRDDDGYHKYVYEVKLNDKGEKKLFKTTYTITEDINGNSMLPTAEQDPQWNTYYCQDATGFHQGFFTFYLLNGSHQLTLEAEREPVIIKSIQLVPYGYEGTDGYSDEIGLPTYEEFKQQHSDKTAGSSVIKLEAEFPDYVSDSSVYATNNNSSSATYPSSYNSQVYNVIGENSYNALGQWAAYKFTVNESGMYKLGMRYLQSTLQGMYICRAIKLSGGSYGLPDGTPTAPFLEAYDAQFNYDRDWQSAYVGDGNKIFEFYFEAGVEYTLYLECSLGTLKNIIKRAEASLNSINDCYLRILQLTGSSPDEYRDYNFLAIMPEVLRELVEQAGELMSIKADLESLCGDETGSHTATLETVAILLDKMGQDNGYEIAANLSNLKSYLGTLGTWINDSKKGTLIVDSITICPSNSDEEILPEAKAGFFSSLWFEIASFFYSFFIDYEAMGLTKEPDENTVSVDVWLATGRDQSNIWRTMVDSKGGFTDKTGYGVNLKLVTGGTLLPSILAGKGPDIYMGLGSADVINYAIREAVYGVSGNDPYLTDEQNDIFNRTEYRLEDGTPVYRYVAVSENGESSYYYMYNGTRYEANASNLPFDIAALGTPISETFDEVQGANYAPAATDTLELSGVTYGVPQTMSFAMMFYRMDVLAELGQEVPETWSQLLSILPTLQSNNMQIGVGYIAALDFMLYQRGGSLWKYEDDPEYAGARIDLDSEIALDAFNFVCRLYTDYSFPVSYDASNRFRTGEMPIVIGDYIGTYNTLTVYATEIDGLWEFCPLPGSEMYDENGEKYINYDSLAGVSATVMLNGCDNMHAAWAFLQWQTSAEVQANYGNKMVALIGPSAKYEAANINAIKDLSWTASEREAIEDQMAHLSSIVNYPGSYIKDRYMKFAFLEAVNDKVDPVEALSQYIDTMNAEITRKREEFDLKVLQPGEEYIPMDKRSN